MNTFGTLFRLTTFGESHGPALGGIIDGMPSGVRIDTEFLQQEMSRRRPGQSHLTTARNETDEVEILSGVFEGKTTGCPIGFIIRNNGQHSEDYANMHDLYRPSHADFTYQQKYGLRDSNGGGRASARETSCRVVGGAFAKMALKEIGVNIQAYTQQIGGIRLEKGYESYDITLSENNPVHCPDEDTAVQMEALIEEVKSQGDTIGGVIACVIKGCPIGLGEPVFGKLHAALGSAMLSINAAKGFEYGMGFAGACQRGSEQNDIFIPDGKGGITTLTNRSGGIQGGISNGQDIYFRVAFKPVATLLQEQDTVDVQGSPKKLIARGRHDACVVPRAIPIVEAMAAMTILDFYLLDKSTQIGK